MGSYNSDAVAGTKTGLMQRPIIQLDGGEENMSSRTGVFKRKDVAAQQDSEEQREQPSPPKTLPEVSEDDGATTGIISLNSEGKDTAKRENHPRN